MLKDALTLDLTNYTQIAHDYFFYLLSKAAAKCDFPLRTLTVSGCKKLSDYGLKCALEAFKHLTTV